MDKPYSIIKKIMEKQGINKYSLAKKTGINLHTLEGYLNSGRNIRIEPLVKIADALNVSVDYLLGRTQIERIDDIEVLCTFAKKVFDDYKANNS